MAYPTAMSPLAQHSGEDDERNRTMAHDAGDAAWIVADGPTGAVDAVGGAASVAAREAAGAVDRAGETVTAAAQEAGGAVHHAGSTADILVQGSADAAEGIAAAAIEVLGWILSGLG